MKKIKVLLAQYKTRYLNIEANINKFNRVIRKYMHIKPDLVVFPEYALTGPLYGHYDLAFQKRSCIYNQLRSIAKKYETFLIPGSFIRKINNKLYNSTCLISSKGELLGFYNKQNLWSSERRFLTPGNNTKVFKTELGSIAIQICADLYSSLISHKYRNLKPDLIVNIAMWSFEDIKSCKKKVPVNIELLQVEQLVKARALENRTYMMFCNHADRLQLKARTCRTYNETSIGSTMIINPYGEIMTKATINKDEILFLEIDISKCHWSKYSY